MAQGIPQRVKLLVDNRLIGGHVYRMGDVVEVPAEKAKEWLKLKPPVAAITDEPITEPGKPRLRSEVLAEQATNHAPARSERAVRQPRAAVAV